MVSISEIVLAHLPVGTVMPMYGTAQLQAILRFEGIDAKYMNLFCATGVHEKLYDPLNIVYDVPEPDDFDTVFIHDLLTFHKEVPYQPHRESVLGFLSRYWTVHTQALGGLEGLLALRQSWLDFAGIGGSEPKTNPDHVEQTRVLLTPLMREMRNSEIVGLYVDETLAVPISIISAFIKDYFPQKYLVWGGYLGQFRECTDSALRLNLCDVAVDGEADWMMTEMVRALLQEGVEGLEDIPGVSFLDGEGAVRRNPPQYPQSLSLDDLPFPDFTGFLPRKDMVHVVASLSRGCSQQCSFCAGTHFKPGYYRRMSAERALAELQYQRSQWPNIRWVTLCDAAVNNDPGLLTEWCQSWKEQYKSEGHNESPLSIAAFATAKPEKWPTNQVHLMYEAGFRFLNIGVESTHPVHQERWLSQSRYSQSEVSTIVRELKENGLRLHVQFIVAWPGDTEEMMTEQLDLISELVRETGLEASEVHFSLFSFDRESLLVRFPKRYELMVTDENVPQRRKGGLLEVDPLFLNPRSTTARITPGSNITVARRLVQTFKTRLNPQEGT